MINVGGIKVANLLPNRLVTTRGRRRGKTLYLTFDDGPHPEYTLKLCDLLDSYAAKATFFCVGENIERYPEIARELIARGHLVANHSDTHTGFGKYDPARQFNDISECQSKISGLNPSSSKIFRAPGGQLDLTLMCRLKLDNWSMVHWSFDSMDHKKMSLDEQLAVFRQGQVSDGEIVLFHDDNQLAADILKVLLPEWKENGYIFNTVADIVNFVE